MSDYFGLDRIISIILLVIPISAWVWGIITWIKEGCYIAGVLRILFGFWILWIGDIIATAINGWNVKILRILAV